MAFDVRLSTWLTSPVNRRLRMLALVKGQPVSHVLDDLLKQHLPPAAELASALGDDCSQSVPADTAGAVA